MPGIHARHPLGVLRTSKSAPGGFVPEGEGTQVHTVVAHY